MKKITLALMVVNFSMPVFAMTESQVMNKYIFAQYVFECAKYNAVINNQAEERRLNDIWLSTLKNLVPFIKAQTPHPISPIAEQYVNNDDYIFGSMVGGFYERNQLVLFQKFNQDTSSGQNMEEKAKNLIIQQQCSDVK